MRANKNDLKRFSKQIILKKIGVVGQKRIFSAKVLVVGVGGLGCPLILYLANSGVGNIGIIDNDKVEESNLNRQILFTQKDIGKFKVLQAKKVIKNINKNIKVSVYKSKIDKNNITSIIKKFDIICDGTDNFKTRYLINDFCLRYKKKLISHSPKPPDLTCPYSSPNQPASPWTTFPLIVFKFLIVHQDRFKE